MAATVWSGSCDNERCFRMRCSRLVGHSPESFSVDCVGRTAVTRGVDFCHGGLRYQVKANRPSGGSGSFPSKVSKASNYDWDRLIWCAMTKNSGLRKPGSGQSVNIEGNWAEFGTCGQSICETGDRSRSRQISSRSQVTQSDQVVSRLSDPLPPRTERPFPSGSLTPQ